MTQSQKNVVDELKTEWKKLWQERLDDKVRAEGIATNDYSSLFVEKGTVIQATKDYKALNLREIIEQHQITNPDRYIPPNPTVGGWTKFIKTNISKNHSQNNIRKNFFNTKNCVPQRPKKSGRGWLHK